MSEITYKIEWVLYVRGMLACNKTNEFTATNYKKLINFISFQSHMNYLVTTDGMQFNCDDFESAKTLIKRIHDLSNEKDTAADLNNLYNSFEVKDILVNGPATIVFWGDGTKTVAKCGPEDLYDVEKAVAMCFMKKALGSRSMKKIFDLAEDRAAEYESQFTRLSIKEMGYCLHDALSTILNQNPAKPCEGKIITDPDKIAEKMSEERKEDKE